MRTAANETLLSWQAPQPVLQTPFTSACVHAADTALLMQVLKQALDVQAAALTQNQEANKNAENKVDGIDREKGRLREAYQAEQQRLSQVLDDVELVKNTLGKTSDDLVHQKTTNGQLRSALLMAYCHTRAPASQS